MRRASLFSTQTWTTPPSTARVDTTFVNPAEFDPEKFQHLAVWFQTEEDGTVTLKVFFKVGASWINVRRGCGPGFHGLLPGNHRR